MTDKIKLYHTSPNAILKIKKTGRFDDGLFFSSEIYSMSSTNFLIYELSVEKNEITDLYNLFYSVDYDVIKNVVLDAADFFCCSEDAAIEILSEDMEISEITDDSEAGWDLQLFQLRLAKTAGFPGVELFDEQGTCYLISMSDKINDLKLQKTKKR